MFRLKTGIKEKTIEIAAEEAEKIPTQWQQGLDVTQMIARFSKDKDAKNLAQSCRFLYHETKFHFITRKLAHDIVVEPNEDKVKAILTLDPKLINVVIKEVIDHSGRILINNTILQLALVKCVWL